MKIMLLGATGSIGQSTLRCIRRFPDRFSLVAMSVNTNVEKMVELALEFLPYAVCIADPRMAGYAESRLPATVKIYKGEAALEQMVRETDFDVLLNALVGSVGLRSTVAGLIRGKCVALANKESLVVGGEYITSILARGQGQLVPVDSEHSAILQCLMGHESQDIESLILTASGGPFRELAKEKFANITPADALAHPTWAMGKKITIDSATLMNKGFELIEAHHLFGVGYDKMRVVVHPQSIVHSMVEYHDGSVIAQMGVPDMELPIQFALSYPQRLPLTPKRLNLPAIGTLTFSEPDFERFPCLSLCISAGKTGGTMPAVVNAANEIAVQAFLDGKISFVKIPELISAAMGAHTVRPADSIEVIEAVDKQTRIETLARAGA
jgi:1-deoxy-D-xylulose-5-phosphate reductoisomerase